MRRGGPDGAEWRDYVRGVALGAAGRRARACAARTSLIAGDVPLGAGLSSSAALEVAVAGALCAVSGIEIEPQRLALLCQKAENQFVGVQCGIMDQFAVCVRGRGTRCSSTAGRSRWSMCRFRMIWRSWSWTRRCSGSWARRPTTIGGKSARRQLELLGWSRYGRLRPSISQRLPEPLNRRARHVVSENRRVLDAVEALRNGDVARFGDLMYESHVSLRDDFAVSTPELDLLVERASQTEGVMGARLTGAGFGGCTVNLVELDAVGRFEASVVEPYREKTGLAAAALVCRAVNGLRVSRPS